MKQRILIATMVMFCGFNLSASAADEPQKAASPKPRGSETSTAAVPKNITQGAASSAPANTDAAKRNDRLVLDSTVVTGNRELPKVMYIVPWKKADLGNLPGQPFNTLLDEALMPVDRDVFRREVQYYQVISGKDQPPVDQATSKPDSK